MANEEWAGVADLVCQTLTKVYVERFEQEARSGEQRWNSLRQWPSRNSCGSGWNSEVAERQHTREK